MTDMPSGPDGAPSPDALPPPAEAQAIGRPPGAPNPAAGWRGLAIEAAQALRFYSRLPVPALPFEDDPHAVPDFTALPRMLPLAGAVLGLCSALVLGLALGFGLPPLVAATLAVATLVVATGAMAEDALADACDGLFGGATIERRLAIMRDSSVGSYGVAALVLALLLRVGTLSAIAGGHGPWTVGAALVAACALSRVAGTALLWALPPARTDGRAASVGRPGDGVMGQAALLASGLTVLVAGPALGLSHALGGVAAAAIAAGVVLRLARRTLGGQTGDVAGAAQHLAETAALLAFAAAPSV